MDYAINSTDDVHIAYRQAGNPDGDPLVLLHPTALSQAIWRGFGYLDGLADRRLILIDQRGHGHSDRPHIQAMYSMDRFVDDLTAVLDTCKIDRADVLGYSLGSRVALGFAITAPRRVNRLILGGVSSRTQSGTFDELFFPGCAQLLASDGMDAFLEAWGQHRGAPVDTATRIAFASNDSQALSAYMLQWDSSPGFPDDDLAAIACPTMVFVGSNDTARLADAAHVAATIPNTTYVVVDGGDHATTPMATDQLLPAINEFLS